MLRNKQDRTGNPSDDGTNNGYFFLGGNKIVMFF